jgi:glutaconate CoA-transferase subunit B
MSATKTEILIGTIARLLDGCRSVVIGNQSPIPGSAALVARELSGGALRVTILGSRKHTDFTNGGVETFDRAAQGRVDVFFLGGGQIDGEANINLVGAGGYPRVDVRWPGSFGSAYLYFLVPRVILFREEHSRRTLVPKVEFVSAAGNPQALLTGKALFGWQKERRRWRLESVHPGFTAEEIAKETGFEFDLDSPRTTEEPSKQELSLLRGPVAQAIRADYPDFAKKVWGLN